MSCFSAPSWENPISVTRELAKPPWRPADWEMKSAACALLTTVYTHRLYMEIISSLFVPFSLLLGPSYSIISIHHKAICACKSPFCSSTQTRRTNTLKYTSSRFTYRLRRAPINMCVAFAPWMRILIAAGWICMHWEVRLVIYCNLLPVQYMSIVGHSLLD